MDDLEGWIAVFEGLVAMLGLAGAAEDIGAKGRSRLPSGTSAWLTGLTALSAAGAAALVFNVWVADAGFLYSDSSVFGGPGAPDDLTLKIAGIAATPAALIVVCAWFLRRRMIASRLLAATPILALVVFIGAPVAGVYDLNHVILRL